MAIQTVNIGASVNDGSGDPTRTAFNKINQNFADQANAASRLVGTAAGNVMEVGAFGIGKHFITNAGSEISSLTPQEVGSYLSQKTILQNSNSVYYQCLTGPTTGTPESYGEITGFHQEGNNFSYSYQYFYSIWGGKKYYRYPIGPNQWTEWKPFWTGHNTTTDGNGFIKAASPIVKIYFDRIELNDDAKKQNITFQKLGIGDYLVKGSLGFAQQGWYIEMPKDANGNVKVAVVYEQLANNDISIKTYAKKLDPETGDVIANLSKPVDIPSTRWIDLRLHEVKPEPTPVE